MKRWPTKPLGELCDVRIGRTPRRDEPRFWGGDAVWVSIRELNGGEITSSKDMISMAAVRECMPDPVPVGTLLFSFKLSIGKMAVAGCPLYTNEAIAALPIRDPAILSRDFLRYAMLVGSHEGTANIAVLGKVLNKDKVQQLRISVPPLSEQERIVHLLDEAEELRKLRTQADHRSKALIPALFHNMFGDPLGGEHKWPEVKFEDVTRRITYGFTCPMKHLESGIPIITAKNVLDGQIDFQNIHYAESGEFSALTAKSKPERNDLLITKDGTIGRCAVVDVDFPLCINQSVALVQPIIDRVIPVFLSHYIQFPSVNAFLNGMGKGQALKHLQITELAKMPIPLPPLPLQKQFAAHVTDIRAMESQQTTSRRRLDDLFQSMLHRAFKGDL